MRRVPGIYWIAGGAALWGTDTVFRQPLAGALGPIQIVLYEHLILAVIVLPIVIRGRARLSNLTSATWIAILGTAWIGSALSTVLFTAAMRSGSPTTAVLLQKTQPVFAIVLARTLLDEVWPSRFPLVAFAAMAGAYLVAFGSGSLLAPTASIEVWPAVLAVGAAFGWAFATICGRVASRDLPFEMVTALRFLLAIPALLVFALMERQAGLPAPGQFVSLLWMALIPGFAGLMLYYRGLQQTPAFQATIAEMAFPVTAALLNWLFLQFSVSALQILGFIVVWGAIAVVSKSDKH